MRINYKYLDTWSPSKGFFHYFYEGRKKTLCGKLKTHKQTLPINQKKDTICIDCLDKRIKNLLLLKEKMMKEIAFSKRKGE